MKVEISKGVVKLTSESSAEYKKLLGILVEQEPTSKKKGRPVGWRGSYKKSAWKGKHRVECPICNKKFKNILLHNKLKHA